VNCVENGEITDSRYSRLGNFVSRAENNENRPPFCKLYDHHVETITDRLLKQMGKCEIACSLCRVSRSSLISKCNIVMRYSVAGKTDTRLKNIRSWLIQLLQYP
jgi:hypothetical protein